MTFRFSKRLSPLFVPAFGLCVATTAYARDDESSSPKPSEEADAGDAKADASERTNGADVDSDGWRDTTPKQGKNERTAQVEADPKGMDGSLALLGSYGPSSDYTQGGLGLRGGLHFTPLYMGLLATYFFNHEQSSRAQMGLGSSTTTKGFMYLGAEAGIDLEVLRDISMRPYIGLGVGRSSNETCGSDSGCTSDTKYPLTITPGVLGLYDLGASLFAGADVRFLIAAGANNVSGPILSATFGFHF